MKQNEENSQKAQELTKEELEQVNGGRGPREPFPGQDPNRTPVKEPWRPW